MEFVSYLGEHWFHGVNNTAYYIFAVVLVACFLLVRWLSTPKLNLPEGPIGLPILGYLPFLGSEPHKTFDRLKEKYGSVFRVRLGLTDVIILADYPAVLDGLSKTATTNRLPGSFDFLPGGLGVSGANGEQWVEQRRFAIRTMRDLGLGKTRWTTLVEEQLCEFIEMLSNKKGQPIDIFEFLGPSMSNNILSLLFGKRFSNEKVLDPLAQTSAAVAKFFSPCALWNFFPWICTALSKLKFSAFNEAFKNMEDYHSFFLKEIENEKKRPDDEKDIDFISKYLEFLQNSRRTGKKIVQNEETMVGDAQTLFLGGSDTTRTGLTWLFLIAAAFPEVQDKAYAEAESVLGNQQIPAWEDHTKFPYIKAVMMEAQRWRTLVPVNAIRMASEDMKILGYDIPKGSAIMSNNWGVHNDSRYWKNPEKFIPERFLINDGKEVNLKPESYVPFSLGKRKCPGESVAIMGIFLYFTSIIRMFKIRTPHGGAPNLDGVVGLVYYPYPQDMCFVPREHS